MIPDARRCGVAVRIGTELAVIGAGRERAARVGAGRTVRARRRWAECIARRRGGAVAARIDSPRSGHAAGVCRRAAGLSLRRAGRGRRRHEDRPAVIGWTEARKAMAARIAFGAGRRSSAAGVSELHAEPGQLTPFPCPPALRFCGTVYGEAGEENERRCEIRGCAEHNGAGDHGTSCIMRPNSGMPSTRSPAGSFVSA